MTWRPMAMPVMRHGSRTGVLPAATSSSCWAAGMKRRAASYAWRPSNDDGTLTLRLRMPDSLAGRHGKYLVVPNVRFASGHDVVLAALGSNTEYAVYRREHGEKEARVTALGQAISYRFKRDAKGWAGIRHHGIAGGGGHDRSAAWSGRGGPECGSSGRSRD